MGNGSDHPIGLSCRHTVWTFPASDLQPQASRTGLDYQPQAALLYSRRIVHKRAETTLRLVCLCNSAQGKHALSMSGANETQDAGGLNTFPSRQTAWMTFRPPSVVVMISLTLFSIAFPCFDQCADRFAYRIWFWFFQGHAKMTLTFETTLYARLVIVDNMSAFRFHFCFLLSLCTYLYLLVITCINYPMQSRV